MVKKAKMDTDPNLASGNTKLGKVRKDRQVFNIKQISDKPTKECNKMKTLNKKSIKNSNPIEPADTGDEEVNPKTIASVIQSIVKEDDKKKGSKTPV